MRRFRFAAFALFVFAPAVAAADTAPIISPFATARPVVAAHGMVVTPGGGGLAGRPRHAEARRQRGRRRGRGRLRAGGHLPRAGNLGGGGFMLIHRADLNKTTAIDYRETAPAATTKDVFLDANGEADPFKSRYSGLAIGVPGTVAGLELAWRRYGSGKIQLRRPDRARRRARPSGPDRRRRCRRLAAARRAVLACIPRPRASISSPTGGIRRPATTSRSTISPRRWTRSPREGAAAFTTGRSRRRSSPRCRRPAGA